MLRMGSGFYMCRRLNLISEISRIANLSRSEFRPLDLLKCNSLKTLNFMSTISDGIGYDYINKFKNESNQIELPVRTSRENVDPVTKIIKVSIVGSPNAGKSTFINNLINRRIFPVSSKVHTTRHKARAILNEGIIQVVLLDTPGLVDVQNSKRHNLEKSFLVDPELSIKESDLIAVIHDVSNAWTRDRLDVKILRLLQFHRDKPSMLILNKVDAMKSKRQLLDLAHTLTCGSLKSYENDNLEYHGEISEEQVAENTTESSSAEEGIVGSDVNAKGWPGFECVFMISALKGIGVNDVKDYILQKSIPGFWMYGSNVYTDQKLEEIVVLAIREKLLECLPQEIPYNVKTTLEHLHVSPTGDVIAVASVICSNKRQQKLIIGKGGEKIRYIAKGAEEALMNTFMENVSLKIRVESKH
ncbi:hypothetical protein J437_LFUL001176 [Ladona fulva]|uniref:GTPase Era, mitochondrial n=1 Tax=Ladona fulva TaxID=123851 RepID=A0A8K0JWR0_LADFU|nr:hypothetical protein J437_LFUL001176 [Ladona fulva]